MNKSKVIKEISQMGFNEQLVEKAFQNTENDSTETIELLKHLKKRVTNTFSEDDYYCTDENCSCSNKEPKDPLKFLRNNKEFSQTREEILKINIDSINSVLAKDFCRKNMNKDLFEDLSLNQESFLKLMTDNVDNVDKISFDIELNDNDNLVLDKIKNLGFSESEILQAYFACDKDENATLDLLNNI